MSWGGEIIGHRGAAGVAPENTLASFEAAIAAGADRIEFDVRHSLDGHAIVFHDATLERLVPAAGPRPVASCALAALRALDVGAGLGMPGCHVPSLEETLAATSGRVLLNVEIKGAPPEGLVTLRLAAGALLRHRPAGVVLSSFHLTVLREAHALLPGVETAWLVDARALGWGHLARTARAAGCTALHPHRRLAAFVLGEARRGGMRVRTWTVNDRAEAEALMRLGVDGIVSDDPSMLRELRDTLRAP